MLIGGRTIVDLGLIKDVVPKGAVEVTDVYSDALLAAATQDCVFAELEKQFETKPNAAPEIGGTTTWLLCIKLMQLALEDRNKDMTMEMRVFVLFICLFVSTSFQLHPVVSRNISGCCLGLLFTLAFLCPIAPWRASTHMQEFYHGILRTLTHIREFTAKQLFHLMSRLDLLHSIAEKNGWQVGNVSSSAVLSGAAARMDKRTLPPQSPLSEMQFFNLAKEAALIAEKWLLVMGFKTQEMSAWIAVFKKASCLKDLVPEMEKVGKQGGEKEDEPDSAKEGESDDKTAKGGKASSSKKKGSSAAAAASAPASAAAAASALMEFEYDITAAQLEEGDAPYKHLAAR